MPHLLSATAPFCFRFSNVPAVFYGRGADFFRQGLLARRYITTRASNGTPPAVDIVVEGREPFDDTGTGAGASFNEEGNQSSVAALPTPPVPPSSTPSIEKDIKKVVQKTAATFAPRASTASKNPAVLGTALYAVFEVQGYASMLVGGALSFNLLFPSNEPDIWRLMGMWSIWMFTIPSLRARDCSKNEKEALNYLFLLVPLLNIIIPFFWKSFAVVWSADVFSFFLMYAWKMGWIQRAE